MTATPCYENEDGSSACPCPIEENEADPIIIAALKCRISWLQYFNKLHKQERDEAERLVKIWHAKWEEERTKNVANRDRLDDAVEELYTRFGEEPP